MLGTDDRSSVIGDGDHDALSGARCGQLDIAVAVAGCVVDEDVENLADRGRTRLDPWQLRRYVDHEAALTLLSGWTGIDLAKYGLDDVLKPEATEASQSVVAAFTTGDPGRTWTMRQLGEKAAIGGRGPVFVGGPQKIADEMLAFADATGIDGFNLAYAVMPESFTDFIDLVVPVLQRRGRYKTAYAKGTLREKLFPGGAARLPSTHPAARHRFV